MAKNAVGSERAKVEALFQGVERMLVITMGFCVYATETGFIGDSCDGVAFPNVRLVPHRPLLAFLTECVDLDQVDGVSPAFQDERFTVFDLRGYSASFVGQSGMSAVIDEEATRAGHIPHPVDSGKLDFNLVPDVHTFIRGLALPRSWRNSESLQASFTFLPGRIGGLPDRSTNNVTSRWGFSDEELQKVRRKTDMTAHLSYGLPTRTIELRKVISGDRAGSITVKPSPSLNLVVAVLTNGWIDEDENYNPSEDMVAVNVSHLDAMWRFCEPIPGESVKIDFGRKEGTPGREELSVAAAGRALGGLNVIDLLGAHISKVAILYNSDVNCSGRRMRMG